MAPVTWSYSAVVKGGSDAVFNWLTDYQPDDHARDAFRRGTGVTKPYKVAPKRTIVSREGNTIKLHDDWGRDHFDATVELVPLSREIKVSGAMGYAAVWKAYPEGEGTKVEFHGTLALKGIWKLLFPLFRKGFLRDMERDFKGHIADLESDLSEQPGEAARQG